MVRNLLNKLSGGQITAIVIAAILAPGAVVAAAALQRIAVADVFTGKASQIDNERQLRFSDALADYRNNPANLVDLALITTANYCTQAYVIPNGQALVITAINGFEGRPINTAENSGFRFRDGAGCAGNTLTEHISLGAKSLTLTTEKKQFPVTADYGSGILVRPGKTISVYSDNNHGVTYIHGYLVPAAAVPALSAKLLANQPKPVSAAQFVAKLKRR